MTKNAPATADQPLTVNDLQPGDIARIISTGDLGPALSRRFNDLGLLPGEQIRFLQRAPLGDPVWVGVKGYQLAFRAEQARLIRVERVRA